MCLNMRFRRQCLLSSTVGSSPESTIEKVTRCLGLWYQAMWLNHHHSHSLQLWPRPWRVSLKEIRAQSRTYEPLHCLFGLIRCWAHASRPVASSPPTHSTPDSVSPCSARNTSAFVLYDQTWQLGQQMREGQSILQGRLPPWFTKLG